MEPNSTTVDVIVYNALAQTRSTPILLPVSSAGSYSVRNAGSPNSTETVIPSIQSLKSTASGAASYVLPLDTGVLPALGAQLFQVTFMGNVSPYRGAAGQSNQNSATREDRILANRGDEKPDVEYSNGLVTAVFDGYDCLPLCLHRCVLLCIEFSLVTLYLIEILGSSKASHPPTLH